MTRPVIVTDHALLRYLERALGIDVGAARAEVEAICRRGAERQAQSVIHSGLRYVLKHETENAVVVTTLEQRFDYVHRHHGREPA